MTIKTADVPETLSLDHEFETRYTEYLKDLKAGEALIMMTTEGSDHVGIYNSLPDHCTRIRFIRLPSRPSRKSPRLSISKKRNQESSPDKPGLKETCQWHSFSKNPRAVTL